jgi:GNAT superfamily N-acetyltransferase
MLPIDHLARSANHAESGLAVNSASAPTGAAIPRQASIEEACAAVRAALASLWFTATTHGPDATAVAMRDQSCAPIISALELWEDWAHGTKSGAVSHALSGESGAVATQLFTSLYDDLVADRPALRSVVDTNMRGDPVLKRFLTDQGGNDVRSAIRQASHNGHYLELAAAVVAPVLEAVCASVLQPKGTFIDRAEFRNSWENEIEGKPLEQDPLAALKARLHVGHTVGLRLLLDRIAPEGANAAAVAPDALMRGADPGTIAMIHEAIATTIAKAVSSLPHDSARMEKHMPFVQRLGQLRSMGEPRHPGLTNVSKPCPVSGLDPELREALVGEMAEHFSELWGSGDPNLATPEIALKSLLEMSRDPDIVFQVQYDRQGKLVSTSTIVDRDEPAFSDTGPGGTDLYGDHWLANVYTTPAYRGQGHATAQIRAAQETAAQRGWPHLWLYCRDEQDGVRLPDFYRKLGFTVAGEESTSDEKETIMRFDTAPDASSTSRSPADVSKSTLLFRAPGAASSFALEWQPGRQAVNVLRTRLAVDS